MMVELVSIEKFALPDGFQIEMSINKKETGSILMEIERWKGWIG